ARAGAGEVRAERGAGEGSAFSLYLPGGWLGIEHPPVDDVEVAPMPEIPALGAGPNGGGAAGTAAELPARADLTLPEGLVDDRDAIAPGDRVLLVVDGDADLASR